MKFVSTLAETGHVDCIVIGGGIVGLATACMLSRKGLIPLIIERAERLCSLASTRSGEGCRAQWELPHNIALARDSIELYANFGEVIGRPEHSAGLRRNGYFYGSMNNEGAEALKRRVTRQQAAGLPDVEFLDGDEVRRRFPLLNPKVEGAAFRQNDGVLSVDRVISGYLAATNGYVLTGTEVLKLTQQGADVEVQTSAGNFRVAVVAVAAGANAGCLIAPLLSFPAKLRPAKASIVRLKVGGVPEHYPAVIDTDHGSFWRPDIDGARITASFSGTLFVDEGVDDPPEEQGYVQRAFESAAHMTPFWTAKSREAHDLHVRTGTFAVTVDGAPIIGPIPDAPNIFLNIGFDGHGVMCSLEAARRLAELVSGRLRHDPDDAFAIERFLPGRELVPEPMTIHQVD